MTTPWRHGRRWMFRKRNSISKRTYKRTGRTSSERPSFDENSLYPTRNISFPPPISNRGPAHGCAFHLHPPCVCLPSPALASRIPRPGRPSRGSRPAPCTTPPRQHVRQPPSPHAPGQPRPLPDTGDAVQHPPFPGHGTKSLPASRRRGPAIRARAKVLRREGARRRRTLFQKRPPLPENKPPSAKTTLPLPCPPLRRHLPKRARPGARQPRRGQASATVRAGGP